MGRFEGLLSAKPAFVEDTLQTTRRDAIALAASAAALTTLPFPALGAENGASEVIKAFTGSAAMKEGGVEIAMPEITEHGGTVPVSVTAPGAAAIILVSTGNPRPEIATFTFGRLAATQKASTRIRLAGTQDLLAVARMTDGSFKMAKRNVIVTIGGCHD